MPKFSFTKKKWGKFADGGALRTAVEQAYDPHLKRGGLILQGGIQQAAPVVSGNLRRTTNTSSPEWHGPIRKVEVGPRAIYAARVNRTSKKNRGFIKRGIDATKDSALGEVRQGAHDLSQRLWVKT